MQFDLIGFLIFLAFLLPGFVAQKARASLAPKPLKPISTLAEVGDFVLAGVFVHVALLAGVCLVLSVVAPAYYRNLISSLHYGSVQNVVWNYSTLLLLYFVLSLIAGYFLGLFQGWQIITQPIRTLVLTSAMLRKLLVKVGISGFLQEEPVWYFVFKQQNPAVAVFLEVEMKDNAGFYTGKLISYGILDDSEKCKDFYLVDVHHKSARFDNYNPLHCDGLLLNFDDVVSVQVVKVQPDS